MKKMAMFLVYGFLVAILPAHGDAAWESLRAVYEREMGNIASEFRAERLALPQRHVAVLRNMEAHFQGEGDLGALLALQQARQQFVLDPTPSGLAEVQSPAPLVRLQQVYRDSFAAAAERRQERIAVLQSQYRSALTRLQADFMRQGQDAEARRVADAVAALQTGTRGPVADDSPEIEIDLGLDLDFGLDLDESDGETATGRPPSDPVPPSDKSNAFDALLNSWFE